MHFKRQRAGLLENIKAFCIGEADDHARHAPRNDIAAGQAPTIGPRVKLDCT